MILGDHRLGQAAPMEELVRLGPSAIQALLAALTDARPTALVIRSEGFLQGLSMDLDGDLSFDDGGILPYTVTVGDVAFTALSEITGRGYAAVRYVPSGLVGITSEHDQAERWRSQRPDRWISRFRYPVGCRDSTGSSLWKRGDWGGGDGYALRA